RRARRRGRAAGRHRGAGHAARRMDLMPRVRSHQMLIPVALSLGMLTAGLAGQAPARHRMNRVIELLEQKQPVFGVYNPGNPQGRRGGPPPADAVMKSPAEWAKDALAYGTADFLFNGSFEASVDRAIGPYAEFVKGTAEAGALVKMPSPHFPHPLIVKTSKIAPDFTRAVDNISRELNLGVSG